MDSKNSESSALLDTSLDFTAIYPSLLATSNISLSEECIHSIDIESYSSESAFPDVKWGRQCETSSLSIIGKRPLTGRRCGMIPAILMGRRCESISGRSIIGGQSIVSLMPEIKPVPKQLYEMYRAKMKAERKVKKNNAENHKQNQKSKKNYYRMNSGR